MTLFFKVPSCHIFLFTDTYDLSELSFMHDAALHANLQILLIYTPLGKRKLWTSVPNEYAKVCTVEEFLQKLTALGQTSYLATDIEFKANFTEALKRKKLQRYLGLIRMKPGSIKRALYCLRSDCFQVPLCLSLHLCLCTCLYITSYKLKGLLVKLSSF